MKKEKKIVVFPFFEWLQLRHHFINIKNKKRDKNRWKEKKIKNWEHRAPLMKPERNWG